MERPEVIVNIAMSVDGKIDSTARKGALISSPIDKVRVDRLRASVDAVLVGGRTLLSEDPSLLVKNESLRLDRIKRGLPGNPTKVGIVSKITHRDIGNLHDFLINASSKVYIITTQRTSQDTIARLRDRDADVFVYGEKQVELPAALEKLYSLGVRRMLVEGGGTILASFFQLNLVDELFAYIAPMVLGGANAPTLADGYGFDEPDAVRMDLQSIERLDDGGGVLLHYKIYKQEE